jgi:hypothetical protein
MREITIVLTWSSMGMGGGVGGRVGGGTIVGTGAGGVGAGGAAVSWPLQAERDIRIRSNSSTFFIYLLNGTNNLELV